MTFVCRKERGLCLFLEMNFTTDGLNQSLWTIEANAEELKERTSGTGNSMWLVWVADRTTYLSNGAGALPRHLSPLRSYTLENGANLLITQIPGYVFHQLFVAILYK